MSGQCAVTAVTEHANRPLEMLLNRRYAPLARSGRREPLGGSIHYL